ncbi:MAG: cyclase family protein [Thermoplasmata archaeon]|nr:cyclase family protein [Thermoplasmata archaeon]
MAYHDISIPIRRDMATFPGDPPVRIEPLRDLARGDPYRLCALAMGTHSGTHVDAPRHFLESAPGVDVLDPEALLGPCSVVEVPPSQRLIGESDLPVDRGARRLLFRTSNSRRWAEGAPYFPDYVALSAAAARELVRRGVQLVGIDSLSIENDQTGQYPVHRTLLQAGAVVLEGLRLAGISPGEYELVCLPLRIESGDGAPARALLRGR